MITCYYFRNFFDFDFHTGETGARSAFVMRWKRLCLIGCAVGTRLCNCIHWRAIEITPLQCLVACPLSTKLLTRLFGSTSEGSGRGSSREQSQTVKMGTVVHVILFNKIVCAFLGGLKETKMFLLHPRVKVSIVGSLRDREVACSASDRQGSNFESCVWRTVSSQSSHHPQEVLLAQFSLYVHKGGLKPDSFHFILRFST